MSTATKTCPYCAEEIRSAAVVCKHCGRDFFAIKPLLDRIEELEHQMSSMQLAIQPIAAALPPAATDTRQRWLGAIFITAAFAVIETYILADVDPTDFRKGYTIMSVGVLGIMGGGYLAGRWGGGTSFFRLSVGAMVISIASLLGAVFFGGGPQWEVLLLPQPWKFAAAPSFLGFLTGGLTANFFGNSVSPRAASFAHFVVPRRHQSDLALDQTTKVIAGLAPILTFIGTLISAYFAYLSKVK